MKEGQMSQRSFKSGKYDVLTGWDEPLQYFFLVIEDETTQEDDDEYVFSNLQDRRDPAMKVSEVLIQLNLLDIEYPPMLAADLLADQRTGSMKGYNYGRVC
jgi:hypothetical protein